MVWLDRLGLLLQFVSAFLMAPEIVGGDRLHRFRRTVTLGQQLLFYLPVGIGLVLVVWAVTFRELDERLHKAVAAAIVSTVALLVLGAVFLLIRRHVAQRFLDGLEDDEQLRRGLLSVGAICFTAGFLLQFAATFT